MAKKSLSVLVPGPKPLTEIKGQLMPIRSVSPTNKFDFDAENVEMVNDAIPIVNLKTLQIGEGFVGVLREVVEIAASPVKNPLLKIETEEGAILFPATGAILAALGVTRGNEKSDTTTIGNLTEKLLPRYGQTVMIQFVGMSEKAKAGNKAYLFRVGFKK